MGKRIDLFQDRLEQLQSGQPLESCIEGLPEQDVELLALVTCLGELHYPEPDVNVAATQRAELLHQAAKEMTMSSQQSSRGMERGAGRSWPRWFVPTAVFSGAMAVLLLCALVFSAGAGLFWLRSRGAGTPPAVASGGTVATQATQMRTPESAPTATPTATPRGRTKPEPTSTPTAEPSLERISPVVIPLEVPDAQSVALRDVQGLVQVQGVDGDWTTVPARGRIVRADERVRTGALSSVSLAFYDGSAARLGPEGELSVEVLDAPSDGPRTVVLTQWSGESEHDIVPSSQENVRYKVNTPAGSGSAQGTRFHVRVIPDQGTYFIVDEGAITVTHLQVTVTIVAGQVSVVPVDRPPSEPVFRVTGEGRVTEIGPRWTIGGQVFETHETTIIVGNPQVGDWVSVEGRLLPDGRRVADRILLLRRAPKNRFAVQGTVETIGETEWVVAGQAITVDEETEVQGDIAIDDLVRVEGIITVGGTLLAKRIVLLEEAPGLPFRFVGVVQEIGDQNWTISGIPVAVDGDTEIDEALSVGNVVEVEGWILPDSSWLARSIRRWQETEHTFEFSGAVESIAPWTVSGIAFETQEWTEIDAGIELGDIVRVKGYIQQDGTWIATEIGLLDDDLSYVHLIGCVESVDPVWIISGVPFVTDEETEVVGDVGVGTWVRVKAQILPGGSLLIKRIAPVDQRWRGGCMLSTAIVVRVEPDQIVLGNGETIPLDPGISIEGELEAYSVVLILACLDEDGTPIVVSIIVIYLLEPPPIVPTVMVPTPTPGPPEEGDVTICHKPGTPAEQTKRVPRSALQAHLGHGDTLGPCE
jgi:hypothetical protein